MWIKFLYLCGIILMGLALFNFLYLRKAKRFINKILMLFKGIVFLILCLGLFWLIINLKAYRSFHNEVLIAVISCKRIGPEEMELIFKPCDRLGKEERFLLRGDQWMVGGEILRWRRPLYLFGFKNLYKLTRINSRYLNTERESLATHFELNGGIDRFWLFLYRNQRLLPFIEAVHGNSVYTFPKEKTIFKLYVNNTGYFLKEE